MALFRTTITEERSQPQMGLDEGEPCHNIWSIWTLLCALVAIGIHKNPPYLFLQHLAMNHSKTALLTHVQWRLTPRLPFESSGSAGKSTELSAHWPTPNTPSRYWLQKRANSERRYTGGDQSVEGSADWSVKAEGSKVLCIKKIVAKVQSTSADTRLYAAHCHL